MTPELLEQFRALLGPAGVLTDSDAMARYCTDWLGKWQGRTAAVLRPGNTEEVSAAIKLCHRHHIPVVPQGGNTGMSGGATPDTSGAQVILSLERLKRIRQVDPINDTLTVEAGVLLAEVQQVAREVDRFFPLSLGAEGSCTLGGNLATNAGGTAVLRYGNMRALTLGLEVVLPDGRIWNGLRGLRKDNTGFDLRDLFIGSEGTLGVITAAVLKLYPSPQGRAVAWVGSATLPKLISLLTHLRASCGERLVAFEMLSASCLDLIAAHVDSARVPLQSRPALHALIELSDTRPGDLAGLLEDSLNHGLKHDWIQDAVIATNERQAAEFWRLREGISQAQVRAGMAIKHDIALPISQIPHFVDESDKALREVFPELPLINFGHLGDGNLHYNVLLPRDTSPERYHMLTEALNRLVHDRVMSHEGSISAEHGVGQLRRDELKHYKSPIELELMLRIKQAIDPNQLMNPGKLL
ncbi:FAD/FMN-containing dehydrogenase [Pseudomonas duriflava]|uniref:FAD/FMN-containing dehydrogenase n=1 Tax=Pseudomonas duriflava TaxID=459528 RepID=A0A562PYY2_9PSED|nr:FAD-binding oxidoreductase [Pseudomonas duriflava]TWI49603.1 FAD/FMN-containing dehydrogenase [Pseudomonas duriflava]